MKSCLLMLMVLLTFSCSPLINSHEERRILCGADAEGSKDYTKIFGPGGTELEADELAAELKNGPDDVQARALVVTSKHCIEKTSETVVLKSKKSEKHLYYLGSLQKDTLELIADTPHLALGCGTETQIGTNFQPSLLVDGIYGRAAFAIRLGTDDDGFPLTLHAESQAFDLSRLPEGAHELQLSSENIFTHEITRQSCPVQVDRTAPQVRLRDLKDLVPLKIAPNQTFHLESDENASLAYCFQAAADTKSCDFIPMKGETIFAPGSGRWILRYYGRDTAGNASDIQAFAFDIFNGSTVEAVTANLKVVDLNADTSDSIIAAKTLLETHRLRDSLATDAEREAVDTKLRHSYWRTGLSLHTYNHLTTGFDHTAIDGCGKRVANYLPNGVIQIYSSRGVLEQEWQAAPHLSFSASIQWSHDCSALVSATGRGEVILWNDRGQGQFLAKDTKLIASNRHISSTVMTDDDQMFATNFDFDVLKVFDKQGKELFTLNDRLDEYKFLPGTHKLLINTWAALKVVDLDEPSPAAITVYDPEPSILSVLTLAADDWLIVKQHEVTRWTKGVTQEISISLDKTVKEALFFEAGENALYLKTSDSTIERCSLANGTCGRISQESKAHLVSESSLILAEKRRLSRLQAGSKLLFAASFEISHVTETEDSYVIAGPSHLVFAAKPSDYRFLPDQPNLFLPTPFLTADGKGLYSWDSQWVYRKREDSTKPPTKMAKSRRIIGIKDIVMDGTQAYCLSTFGLKRYLGLCDSDVDLLASYDLFIGIDGMTIANKLPTGMAIYDVKNLKEPILQASPACQACRYVASARDFILFRDDTRYYLQFRTKLIPLPFAYDIQADFEAQVEVTAFADILVFTEPGKQGVSIVRTTTGEVIRRSDLVLEPFLTDLDFPRQAIAVFHEIDNPLSLVLWEGGEPKQKLMSSVNAKQRRHFVGYDHLLTSRYAQHKSNDPLVELHDLTNGTVFTYKPQNAGPDGFAVLGRNLHLFEDGRELRLSRDVGELRAQLCDFIRSALTDQERAQLCPGP